MSKPLHPTQTLAIKIMAMFMEEQVPPNIAMGALGMCLILTARKEGMSKAEILNAVGNNIDTIEKDIGGKQ
jgi:hypothetical protein